VSVQGSTGDLLATIVAATRRAVEVRRQREPLPRVERAASSRVPAGRMFVDRLGRPDQINVIAECKRRSPSRGVLRADYDPVAIARGYAAAGAAAISVLTEPTFFDGSIDHLIAVRGAVNVPLLRKDFVIDRYQVVEARAAGADAILLIVAALTRAELGNLMHEATAHDLAALVEVHEESELDVAVDQGATVIGVNNRNLRTLTVSVEASERLIGRMPDGCIAVAESGLRSHADLIRLRALGYHAFLVGERLMASPDPGKALSTMMTAAPAMESGR
jgi:indole-3-glycerol phosphate synthase